MKTISLIILAVLCHQFNIYSQSSVYFCRATQAVGWCYNSVNSGDCAYQECVKVGGKFPELIVTCSGKGWGVIVEGKNSSNLRVVGVGCGYDIYENAYNRAVTEIYNAGCVITPTEVIRWDDATNKDNTNINIEYTDISGTWTYVSGKDTKTATITQDGKNFTFKAQTFEFTAKFISKYEWIDDLNIPGKVINNNTMQYGDTFTFILTKK